MPNKTIDCEKHLATEDLRQIVEPIVRDAIDKISEEKLRHAAELGAKAALQEFGLSRQDFYELGSLLKNWRTFKTEAGKSAINWLTKVLLTALVVGLSIKAGLFNIGLFK